MSDQDALVHVLLVNELGHVFCHGRVAVVLGMERLAMVPKILRKP